jgi:hypothetical protein
MVRLVLRVSYIRSLVREVSAIMIRYCFVLHNFNGIGYFGDSVVSLMIYTLKLNHSCLASIMNVNDVTSQSVSFLSQLLLKRGEKAVTSNR